MSIWWISICLSVWLIWHAFFSWMPRVTWKKILGMFYNILTCNAPKNSNFQFMFDPLQFALLRSKEKEVEEDGMQKIPLIFPLARWSSFQVQGHHEVLLHLHSYKSWSSSLFKKFYLFFEVSYGLFSNCFDLVLTPNGEPCFEYFMAKNLKESKNIPFFPK